MAVGRCGVWVLHDCDRPATSVSCPPRYSAAVKSDQAMDARADSTQRAQANKL